MLEAHERYMTSVYEAHHAALVRRLTAVTRNPDDAEDLAHEAYLRLATEIEAGRGPDDAAAWLHRVGWNLAMSRGRHRSVVDRKLAELPRPASPATPDRTAIGRETHAAIEAALAELPDTERQALVLAAQGYRGDEVAASIGRTVGATRTLLCRARSKLRVQLGVEILMPV
jgi:RNA polymerase sigma-70 factor, ECF subfamily